MFHKTIIILIAVTVLLVGLGTHERLQSSGTPPEPQFGLRGDVGITPMEIKVRELPKISQPYQGIVREIPEGEPPYAPPFPAPNASELPNVTLDRHTKAPQITPLAPTLGTSVEGITQGRYIPSEPQPAAGPLNFFSIGNTSVTISNKDGSSRVEYGQNVFFGIPVSEDSAFDAKCYYDAQRGRFVVLTETQGSVGNNRWSYYYLAVSKTSDAGGDWWVYKFDMTKDGSTSTNNWSDFPGLGVSDDKIIMSGQQFSFGGNQYQHQKLRVVDRAKVYSGQSVTYVDFFNYTNQVFVTKPGRNLSRDSTIYLLATQFNGGNNVVYGKITGTSSNPQLSFGTTISVNSYGAVIDAKGGSGTSSVNCGDARTPDFIVRNGYLNIAWHFGISFSGTTYDGVRYLKLNILANPPTVITDETFAASGIYYYYPMCTIDSVGTMFIGFGRSSTSEYPSSYVSGKRRSDASIQSSALAKAGTAVTSQSRWGDFTGIDMDETASNASGSSAWYAGQWTKASNAFGTWITKMNFTYGEIAAQVLLDADGDTTTTGDRTPAAGQTITLKQGTTTVASSITDGSGNIQFGYLETGVYDAIGDGGYFGISVIPGSGGTSETRRGFDTIRISLTNTQTSTGNTFIVATSPLPIQIASFTGSVVNGENVVLEWTTLTEVNNFGFYVQRRTKSEEMFTDLPHNFISGHGTTTEPQQYTWTDENVSIGIYHYRLHQVDLDGSQNFSPIVTVTVESPLSVRIADAVPAVFKLNQNYPNPFNPATMIEYSIPPFSKGDQGGFVTLKIYNTLGEEIATLVNEHKQPGYYTVKWDASGIPSGVYFYRLTAGSLISIKKLVLMK